MKAQIDSIRFTRGRYPVAAYVDMIMTLAGGARIGANSVRLVHQKSGDGIVVSFPRTPPKRDCRHCGFRCPDHGPYCPKCGVQGTTAPPDKGLDIFYPMEAVSRKMVIDAIMSAFNDWESTNGGSVDNRDAIPLQETQRGTRESQAMGRDVPRPRG